MLPDRASPRWAKLKKHGEGPHRLESGHGAAGARPQVTALAPRAALRSLNRSLFAGLEEFEVHLTRYGRGAFYARHIDLFEDTTRRAISVVLYLNHHWRRQDGGALRLWTTPAPGREPPSSRTPYLEVLPEAGTLVVFRSADFWHEVRRARRPRLSLTGWFQRRPANPLERLA